MKISFWHSVLLILIVVLMGCNRTSTTVDLVQEAGEPMLKPPVAQVKPHEMTLFGDTRVDNYYWLRERGSAAVLDYLKAENAYTAEVMQHTKGLQQELYEEMKGRIKETDLSVPVKMDQYYYYTRTEEGRQYDIHCRKLDSLEAPEEVLLDENVLAEGKDYFNIGEFEISPDHKTLAYSVDLSGGEHYTIFFKDLETGTLYPEQIPDTYYSLEWANDNQTIFYTTIDEAMRPFKLFRHTIGTNPSEDVLVYHETDDSYFLRIAKSKSQAYLFLELGSQVTTEIHFLAAAAPQDSFRVIHPRQYRMEYSVVHHDQRFFILTNDDALNFKLMVTAVTAPEKASWTEVIGHQDKVILDQIDIFKDFLIVVERDFGLRKILIHNLSINDQYFIEFPEATYKISLDENPDFNSNLLRFIYSSFITPNSVYDYDMVTRERELKKQDEILGGYDPAEYETARIFATSEDGQEIPISIVYRTGMIRNGENPVYLYGYGSYGSNTDPKFRSYRFSLIDRGFVYAIAHIRGSSYLGRGWYEDGKLLNKRNTFTDFIACAEYLVEKKYTKPEKLTAVGGSAGGLLVGAVVNMRPELFDVVIADVPFVDAVTTMLDESIPLTVIEFDEWGNPSEEDFYWYLKNYSPYDNVEAKVYPNLLVTAGLNDPRVQYWEPAKWAAKLRATKTDYNRLLLKTNMGAGHHGASGRFDYLKEIAFEYAFILDLIDTGDRNQ